MKSMFLSVAALLLLQAAPDAAAQTKTTPTASAPSSAPDRYLLQNGEVVLLKGGRAVALTKNPVLPNGTKINYKSAIVEFSTGKKTTLRDGDYVTLAGDIVFGTPGSAAQARNDNSVPADAKYEKYVLRGTAPASATAMEGRLSDVNKRISLMAQKIQLLNDKISLMTPQPANQTALDNLNQQIKSLDEQLRQVK